MKPYEVSRSRTYPAGVARAFDAVLPVPLPDILGQRVGLIPAVTELRGQDPVWGTAGQTRTIVTSDRGRLLETLTGVERPDWFGYHLDVVSGPMKPLVRGIEGRWDFEQAGTGVRITWSWWITPSSGLTARLMPLIGRSWRGAAARALENIEDLLLPVDS